MMQLLESVFSCFKLLGNSSKSHTNIRRYQKFLSQIVGQNGCVCFFEGLFVLVSQLSFVSGLILQLMVLLTSEEHASLHYLPSSCFVHLINIL